MAGSCQSLAMLRPLNNTQFLSTFTTRFVTTGTAGQAVLFYNVGLCVCCESVVCPWVRPSKLPDLLQIKTKMFYMQRSLY